MILLSLDPGVTTGWAVLGRYDIYDCGNLLDEDLRVSLIGVIEKWAPSEAVVELFPLSAQGQLATTLRHVVYTIEELLLDYGIPTTGYAPGQWKTSSAPKSPDTWDGTRTTTHQRDAIRMGKYHLSRKDRTT